MNFGDCPYCDDFTGFHKVPDKTPCYAKVNCESCGKEFWYRLSRVDPQAWIIEDFENEFDVDHENMRIEPKKPKAELTPTDKAALKAYLKELEQIILYGTGENKPLGILKGEDIEKE